jgi:hypothetical protein
VLGDNRADFVRSDQHFENTWTANQTYRLKMGPRALFFVWILLYVSVSGHSLAHHLLKSNIRSGVKQSSHYQNTDQKVQSKAPPIDMLGEWCDA